MTFSKQNIFKICLIVLSVIISLLQLYYFLEYKMYLIGSDGYYYQSVAHSILEQGEFIDSSTEPAQPIRTPQHGITSVYVLLYLFNFGNEASFVFVTVLNYLLWLSAIVPAVLLIIYFGGSRNIAWLYVVLHLSAWHVYRYQLIPINDGVFNVACLWLVWATVTERWKTLTLLSIFTIHFKLYAIAVFMGLLVGSKFKKEVIKAISISILLFGGFYLLFVDLSMMINEISPQFIFTNESEIYQSLTGEKTGNPLKLLFLNALPGVLGYSTEITMNMIYVVFYVVTILGLCRKESILSIVVLMVLLMSLLMGQIVCFDKRFHMVLFPFFYILLGLNENMRAIFYLFVGFVLITSCMNVLEWHKGYEREASSEFWYRLNENPISLKDIPIVSESYSHVRYHFDKGATLGVVDGKHYRIGNKEFAGDCRKLIRGSPEYGLWFCQCLR